MPTDADAVVARLPLTHWLFAKHAILRTHAETLDKMVLDEPPLLNACGDGCLRCEKLRLIRAARRKEGKE